MVRRACGYGGLPIPDLAHCKQALVQCRHCRIWNVDYYSKRAVQLQLQHQAEVTLEKWSRIDVSFSAN